MKWTIFTVRSHLGWAAAVLIGAGYATAAQTAVDQNAGDTAALDYFEKRIRPVLVENCYKCHSAKSKKLKGGLLLDTREGIRKGGDSGHAVVPGSLEDSLLIEAIRYEDLEMPPDGKLPDEVIADFEKWILMGAPDPRGGEPAPVRKGIDLEKARRFWAFQAVRKPEVPRVQHGKWPLSDIDRFVAARLEEKGLKPVGDADPGTLVRRAYFDLIGLPPEPEVVEAFEKDPSAQAFERLVDRLLATQQYGERWGRHWLDVARFAESTGKERNYTFPEAWRYRDYVIASFNADKPYDRFVTEQIAGDLLPSANDDQRVEQVIATGFLAIGPKSLNQRNREKFRMDLIDDQIDATSRAFLALTISCARCHDHKFDPIPTKEYYSLAGIFGSTQTFYGTGRQRGNRQTGSLLSIRAGSDQAGEAPEVDQKLSRKLSVQLRKARAELKKFQSRRQDRRMRGLIAKTQARIKKYTSELSGLNQQAGSTLYVMAVQENGSPTDCRICIRGDESNRGEVAPRGFLSVITSWEPPRIDSGRSGRLELARWLTDPRNPLTARVMVNRIWQHLFGRGLVRTVDNFGANGERASHPRLLDYLARRFVNKGWSVKRMIRTIMLSRAYQLSSAYEKEGYAVDPDNVLFWRMNQRRLDAEAIRDAILAVSDQLQLTPPGQSAVAKVGNGGIGRNIRIGQFNFDNSYRSVYLPIIRDLVPEALKLFDFAEPSLVVGRRDVTTVPAQALFLMNSPFVSGQSEHAARRLLASRGLDDSGRVELAYMLALARPPTDAERSRALAYVRHTSEALTEEGSSAEEEEIEAWASFCQALIACAEFRYLN